MATEISVTEKHIAEGAASDCRLCPVAKAINDVIGPMFHCKVFLRVVEIFEPGDIIAAGRILLPAEVVEFIRDFDGKEHVSPITFTLDLSAVIEGGK